MRASWAFAIAALLPATAEAATIETFNLPNNQPTCGIGIADDDTVVGDNQATSNPEVNFIYRNKKFIYLKPNLPSGLVAAIGINDHHVVVGEDLSVSSGTIGYREAGAKTTILALPQVNATQLAATDINNAGTTVGWYETAASSTDFGFIDRGGVITTLNDGTVSTLPAGINRAGTAVVGISLVPPALTSWLYEGGTYTTLAVPNATGTAAHGVYGLGWVTGTYVTGTGTNLVAHGFIYHSGHYWTFDIKGASQTQIEGVNENGHFTGCYTDGTGEHGFIARQGG